MKSILFAFMPHRKMKKYFLRRFSISNTFFENFTHPRSHDQRRSAKVASSVIRPCMRKLKTHAKPTEAPPNYKIAHYNGLPQEATATPEIYQGSTYIFHMYVLLTMFVYLRTSIVRTSIRGTNYYYITECPVGVKTLHLTRDCGQFN